MDTFPSVSRLTYTKINYAEYFTHTYSHVAHKKRSSVWCNIDVKKAFLRFVDKGGYSILVMLLVAFTTD